MNETRIIQNYKSKVRHDHQSRTVRAYFSLYAWFWFHTEFWLEPEDRRPYTYIMRDWIYPHLPAFVAILLVWYAGLLAWAHWSAYPPLILGILSSLLVAHLIWGSEWIPNEQEEPPYLG